MLFFRKKPENRKLQHRNVLEVKASSRQKQAQRARLAAYLIVGLAALSLVILIIWQATALIKERFLYRNPAYAIRVIDITTDGVISREQLRRWAGVNYGDNLMALDIARVRRDLELIPMIKSVSVEKVFPGTLRIRVFEREPIAQVFVKDGFNVETIYTLDETGFVMVPLHFSQMSVPAPTNEFLPTIIGVGKADLRPGSRVNSPQIVAAVRFLASFERSPMAGLTAIRLIDVSENGILQVQTDDGSKVVFRADQFDIQLRRWRLVYDYGRKQGKQPATLDLSVANNVPATWMDAPQRPPSQQPINKPSRITRRKNA